MSSAVNSRVESPTSILTYTQCPRKYYYRYVQRLGHRPNIHLVVGDVVHSTISAFHNADVRDVPGESLVRILHTHLVEEFRKGWNEKKETLRSLGIGWEDEKVFYQDAWLMLDKFFQHHVNRAVARQYRHNVNLVEAFRRLRPKTETKIFSKKHGLMGVIDAIFDFDGKLVIIDYKTSKKAEMTDECLTQLALYALLYEESAGRVPDLVGIHFLRHGEMMLRVTPELLALGEDVRRRMQALVSGEDIIIYPQRITGLCKYRTGQCDYYEQCKPWNSIEFAWKN